MMEVTVRVGNIAVSKKSDGESADDLAILLNDVGSWAISEDLKLVRLPDEDNNIYCEGIEPVDEREMEGL